MGHQIRVLSSKLRSPNFTQRGATEGLWAREDSLLLLVSQSTSLSLKFLRIRTIAATIHDGCEDQIQ